MYSSAFNYIELESLAGVIPQCAMKVTRDDDGILGPMKPKTDNTNPCGCAFEKFRTGVTSCTACPNGNSDCSRREDLSLRLLRVKERRRCLSRSRRRGFLALSFSLAVVACGSNNTTGTGGRGGSTVGRGRDRRYGGTSGTRARADGGLGTGGTGGSVAGSSGGSTGGSGGSTGGSGGATAVAVARRAARRAAAAAAGPAAAARRRPSSSAGRSGAAAMIDNCIINLPTDSVGQTVTFTPPVDYNTCKM